MSDIKTFAMPTFQIDTVIDTTTNEKIPGIKRMYEIAYRIKDSLMQWGGPGIGKSQAVQQWNAEKVKEYNEHIAKGEKVKPWNPTVCDVRLSMKEPVDLIGVPTIQIETVDGKGKPTTVWATPSMWPQDNGEFSGGVIHLDEMNQGQAAILNAAFQLIQDRALGEYKVPEGYLIIASSNPPAFNNTVTELSIPLSNRFSHFNIVANFDSWFNHRLNHGGNVDVLTFLKTQGSNLLYDNDTMKKRIGDDASALFTDLVVTPRSWEVVEKVLSLGNEFTELEKRLYCTGRLGSTLTSRLFNYIADKAAYQDWHEILVDGKPFKSEEQNVFWAVQIACMSAITNEKNDETCRKYVLNLIAATRKLKNPQLKGINIAALVRCTRLTGDVFSPLDDAGDLVNLVTVALRH